jgi:CheY-like chemotaxis protein
MPRWLLADDEPEWLAAQEPQSQSAPAKANFRNILVVDDEASIADSLTEILVGFGYNASAFYDGRAAIESARRDCPDLVVSDVVMPKLNGIDTVLAIRQHCPGARILLFSGQAGTFDILAGARAKGHEFELLAKPIHPDQLLRKLASLR